MSQPKWEQVTDGVMRMPVFGGWLIRCEDWVSSTLLTDSGGQRLVHNQQIHTLFIPDINHEWDFLEEQLKNLLSK